MIARLDITRVVIAHRPALVEKADIVFNLDGGKISLVRGGAAVAPKEKVPSPSMH